MSSSVSSVGLRYGKKQGIARFAVLLLVFSFACLLAVLLTAAPSVLYAMPLVQAPYPGYSPAAARVWLACEVSQLAGVTHHCQPFPSRVTLFWQASFPTRRRRAKALGHGGSKAPSFKSGSVVT